MDRLTTPMPSLPTILLMLLATFPIGDRPAQTGTVLYPIVESGKWGYLDQAGRIAIQPRFDAAKPFSEGLARVKIGQKWGFIDRTGNLAIPPQFEISLNGDATNDSSLDFHEGMAAVSLKQGEKWGYIDQSGRMVIPPKYDVAERFAEGLARVGNNYSETVGNATALYHGGAARYIDKSGRVLSLPIVGETFSEGLAIAAVPRKRPTTETDLTAEQKTGYIDRTGQFKIAPQFWALYDFSEGLARVRAYDRDLWGYINHNGTMVIKMQYEDAGDFSEGLARVSLNNRMGFIDKSARLVIRPSYVAVGNFSGGLASACMEDNTSPFRARCGYLDKTGGWSIAPMFTFLLGDFKGSLALACTEKTCGYIDREGEFVWLPKDTPMIDVSTLTGCSIMSDKSYQNYPCKIDFKLF
jgi:hypothetical protein